MDNYLQGILTIFSLVNPVICAQIFNSLERGKNYNQKLKDLTKTILIVGVILSSAAFFGARLLQSFGISLDAFQVAGGIVLIWMGFGMLSKSSSEDRREKNPSTKEVKDENNLVPLVLFAASPGTITGVITLSITQSDAEIPLVALFSIVGVLLLTWVIVAILSRKSASKPSMTNQVTTKFMGLIVLAMGVQFLLSGIKDFYTPLLQ
ncbi:MarC family protein [Flammeovirga kamogawensis]|uniref:UPF0056 membrane protein n=1 Tax=Flammeovirga kamogawensis TaxID=373891 RepID=A0ABX8GSM7_9BACT|nr:MarC family protein [Flammeovirga kamogawensis]MBB6462996.1 multiple antibiotic resistance protein [Flammeovirga kamogawensis]QWG06521.1 MarC family protein [Flammeovirga kamogawensis]TRX68349.1 MarC family protein [Flammeovirga kamogawensis]